MKIGMIKSKYKHLRKKWKTDSKKHGLSPDAIREVTEELRRHEAEEIAKELIKEHTPFNMKIWKFLKSYWLYIIFIIIIGPTIFSFYIAGIPLELLIMGLIDEPEDLFILMMFIPIFYFPYRCIKKM